MTNITPASAERAARAFLRQIERQWGGETTHTMWTLRGLETFLPAGTWLGGDVRKEDFYPLSIRHVARVIRDNAVARS